MPAQITVRFTRNKKRSYRYFIQKITAPVYAGAVILICDIYFAFFWKKEIKYALVKLNITQGETLL